MKKAVRKRGTLGLIILAVLLWSWLGPLAKLVFAHQVTAYQLVAFRVLFAWMALVPWSFKNGWWRVEIKRLPFLLFYSIFSVTLNYLGFYVALRYISVTAAIVILYTYPAIVLGLSHVLLKEPVGAGEAVALALTLIGVFLIVQGYHLQKVALNAPGFGWALLAAVSVAIYNVAGKHLVRDINPWKLLFWGLTIGGAILWLAYPIFGRNIPLIPLSSGWGLVLCIALFPTLVGYGLYLVALKHIQASQAAIISTLEPLLASLWAAVFLGESLETAQMVGGALVLAGASLILWRRT